MPILDAARQYRTRGVSVRVAARTDIGLVRGNNEDSFVVGDLASGDPALAAPRIGPAGMIFGVCDGMGGAAAGEVASRIATNTLLKEMSRVAVHIEAVDFSNALGVAVEQAGVAIRENVRAHPSRKGMGTTCTMAAVRGSLMFVAQVGDSRAYLMRDGSLRQLTRDQNWANELLAKGHITPEQAAHMEHGNHILQAVGSTEKLEVELTSFELCRGDRVLVCSDGLTGMVPDEQIALVLTKTRSDLEAVSDELVNLAKAAGGRDNITVVLCEFTGAALPLSKDVAQLDEELEFRLPVSRWPRWAVLALAVGVLTASSWRMIAREDRSAAKSPVRVAPAITTVLEEHHREETGAAQLHAAATGPGIGSRQQSTGRTVRSPGSTVRAHELLAPRAEAGLATLPMTRPRRAVSKAPAKRSVVPNGTPADVVSAPEPTKRNPFQ